MNFAWADSDTMRATNESYALKINIIVILTHTSFYLHCIELDSLADQRDTTDQGVVCTGNDM